MWTNEKNLKQTKMIHVCHSRASSQVSSMKNDVVTVDREQVQYWT